MLQRKCHYSQIKLCILSIQHELHIYNNNTPFVQLVPHTSHPSLATATASKAPYQLVAQQGHNRTGTGQGFRAGQRKELLCIWALPGFVDTK